MLSITKFAFVAVGALAAVAGAQDVTSFPNCAQWCIRSMQQANKTEELGCSDGDNACLCRNANFAYGVRDCSAELCVSSTTGEQALNYVFEFCKNEDVQLSTVVSSGTLDATGGAGDGGGAVPVSTVDFTSTITTDGSTITTTGASTMFSTPTGSISPSASASQIVSTIVSDGSTFVSSWTSQLGSATSQAGSAVGSMTSNLGTLVPTNTADSTDASNTNSPQETSTSQGFAAQITAAPAGILAVAGVAAFFL